MGVWLWVGSTATMLALMAIGVTKYLILSGRKLNPVLMLLSRTDGVDYAMLTALLAIIGPCSEELLFRGIFYNLAAEKYSWPTAALGTSILFATVHGSIIQWVPLCCGSLIITLQYQKTRSLIPGMITHGIANIAVLVSLYR